MVRWGDWVDGGVGWLSGWWVGWLRGWWSAVVERMMEWGD